MSACPLPTDPDWKKLIIELGSEADAHTAFVRNNYQIPSVDKAKDILKSLKVQDKDEQLSLSSNQFKLARAIEQRIMLETVKLRTNPAQRQTIEKLIEMNDSYQEFLKQNIKEAQNGNPTEQTLSVSRFIGSSEFRGDPKEYEAFKLFGTFMHQLLEDAQVEALKKNQTIAQVYNREFFEQVYQKYIEKNPFEIQKLSKDEMYEMAMGMVANVNVKNASGYVILPEITVVGTSREGTKVIGRLDILMIDPQGKIHIYDFKTKKVDNMIETDFSGQKGINLERALYYLANRKFSIDQKPGTGREFQSIITRSTYDTWMLQLSVYENILKQAGMDVRNKTIATLMYQVDDTTKEHLGNVLHVFEDQDYYDQSRNVSLSLDNAWFNNPATTDQIVTDILQAAAIEIPIGESKAEDENKKQKTAEETYDFNPTDKNMTDFVRVLEAVISGQITKVYQELEEESKKNIRDSQRESILKARRDSLNTFKAIIDKLKTSEPSVLVNSVNFFNALHTMDLSLKAMHEISRESLAEYRNSKNPKDNGKYLAKVQEAFNNSVVFQQVLDVMQEIVNEASQNENTKITPDSPVRKKLSELFAYTNMIQSNFKEIGMANAIENLLSPGESIFKGVSEEVRQATIPMLEEINKKLEQLKSDPKLGLFEKIKFSTFSLFSKSFKEKLKEALGPDGDIVMTRIAELERQKLMLENIIKGYEYTPEAMEKYINGMTDPAAMFYPGMQNPLENDTMMSGWSLDSAIASASNSDLAISAFTTMLKDFKSQAEYNAMSDVKMQEFDRIRQKLLDQGFTIDELNKAISGWRRYVYFDKEKNQIAEGKRLTLIKPFTEEYEMKYKSFSYKMKQLNKELYEAKGEYHTQIPGTPEQKAAYDKLQAKTKERDDLSNENISWMLENCNLPYVDEFYKLQLMLPQEIRDKLQRIYLEQETILHNVGKGNEVLLDDADFDRLEELDAEAKNLRIEAAEQNPEYAQYLEKFDELFEYDTNDNYFRARENNAKVQFSDDKERLEKWYSDNTVTRPTPEWYETLNDLYDQRAQIYGSDPAIQELIERKSRIKAPYKSAGRFNPKYLSDEEVAELDAIDNEIEDILNQKSKNKASLSKEERKMAAEISAEINRLVSRKLSPIYVKDFNNRYDILKTAFIEMNNAQTKLTLARNKGDKAAIDEAENDVLFAVKRFGEVEVSFKQYYEKYHNNKYESIRENPNFKDYTSPKSFNFERLPASNVSAMYMETVPNPKYYKVKRIRIGNWTLNGRKMKNAEIEELQKDPDRVRDLQISGELVIRPGGYNPSFIKGPDGIPLPKSLMRTSDGQFVLNTAAKNTNNVDPQYLKIIGDPQMFELYASLTDMYFGLQKQLEGRSIGYQIPGFAGSLVESMASEGKLAGIKKQINAFIDSNLKTAGQQDITANTYGDISNKVRMRFSTQLEEGLQSTDAIGSIMKWSVEAHMATAMQEVAPKAEVFVEYMKLQREQLAKDKLKGDVYTTDATGKKIKLDIDQKIAQIDNLIKILEFEKNKFLYGITESDKNRKAKKMIEGFFKYTSFIRIGFDVANQTKNYISGNLQAFMAAGNTSSNHYNKKNWLFAKSKVYGYGGFLSNYFKDWGRISDLSETTMLYRMINPGQKDHMKYFSDAAGGKKRRLLERATSIGDLGFFLQDKGDTEVAVTVMYAVMDNYKYEVIESVDPVTGEKKFKLDAEGKPVMVPAHEAYVADKNGNLVIRKDVNYTKQDEKRLRNIIYSEMRRAQGNYAGADQTQFESKVLGRMVFFFRKFLVPTFLNRFGYMRPNWEAGEVAVGYWRAVAKAIKFFGVGNTLKEFLVGSNTLSKIGMTGGVRTYVIKDPKTGKVIQSKDVGDFYAKHIHHARRDAMAMLLMTILGGILLSYVRRKDDDDEELGVLEGNAVRVIWGVRGETLSMFPIGQGTNEYLKNFTTAIPFLREATAVKNLLNHGLKYGMAMTMNGGVEPDPEYDTELYQEIWKDAYYSRESGAYEKGDPKLVKDLVDLTGIKNFRDLLDPNNRIEILKRNQ
jgi:hypothetical protein